MFFFFFLYIFFCIDWRRHLLNAVTHTHIIPYAHMNGNIHFKKVEAKEDAFRSDLSRRGHPS